MKLTYFKLRSCPYCRAADKWLSELRAEKPEYADIEIEEIVETSKRLSPIPTIIIMYPAFSWVKASCTRERRQRKSCAPSSIPL